MMRIMRTKVNRIVKYLLYIVISMFRYLHPYHFDFKNLEKIQNSELCGFFHKNISAMVISRVTCSMFINCLPFQTASAKGFSLVEMLLLNILICVNIVFFNNSFHHFIYLYLIKLNELWRSKNVCWIAGSGLQIVYKEQVLILQYLLPQRGRWESTSFPSP